MHLESGLIRLKELPHRLFKLVGGSCDVKPKLLRLFATDSIVVIGDVFAKRGGDLFYLFRRHGLNVRAQKLPTDGSIQVTRGTLERSKGPGRELGRKARESRSSRMLVREPPPYRAGS